MLIYIFLYLFTCCIFLYYCYTLKNKYVKCERSYNEKVQFLCCHDTLTGLPNRLKFGEMLGKFISGDINKGRQLGILFVDIDRFKNVNATLGHEIGDKLLVAVADRLRLILDGFEGAEPFRTGGDEFVILAPCDDNLFVVIDLARTIVNRFEAPFNIEDLELYATFTIGISVYPMDGTTTENLLKNAALAMNQTKKEGKSDFKFYSDYNIGSGSDKFYIANSLRSALDNNEFAVFYQGKFNPKTKGINSMEALLRWKHPELGLVSPEIFIPIAEEMGLIVPIGEWVLKEACKATKRLQYNGFEELSVSVNLSALQFKKTSLVDVVSRILSEEDLKPHFLELEITESTAVKNYLRVNSMLTQLRALGVKIALDDFGTGYSSLSYLQRISIDNLKIDRTFISDIAVNKKTETILTGIINMAHSLGFVVTAEGVENSEQYSILLEKGCDYMQGYLFSKPLPEAEFERLLRNCNYFDETI
jgi:diguanylate cyclase (GGDEF)-like protein